MEDVLHLYNQPYDAQRPLICFDERPCQLLEEVWQPLPMKMGKVKKQQYSYRRKGTCCLLVAFEPHTAQRWVWVVQQRTMKEYALFLAFIAAQHPGALTIRWVQDNLSTHKKGAFYGHLPAEKAFALAQLFEFHFTPVNASWLNMVEIELSVIARRCLKQRIASMEELTSAIDQLVKERNELKATVNWQFSIPLARKNLKRWYDSSLSNI